MEKFKLLFPANAQRWDKCYEKIVRFGSGGTNQLSRGVGTLGNGTMVEEIYSDFIRATIFKFVKPST